MYIQFYPTLRCNLSCEFCFNRDVPMTEDMPLADFRLMLGTLKTAGARAIDIMGGEPTLHPGIETMIGEAEEAGFLVNISSNGTDLPGLERIIANNGRTTVGISVNDREDLERVGEFIVQHHPLVKTVFRKDLDLALIEDILAVRPKRFFLLYRDAMHASGIGQAMAFAGFLAFVRERFGDDTAGTVFCSGFLPDTGTYPELAHVRCPAGTTKLGVMPDGSVYPCNLFFGRKDFLLGNILTDPFSEIWGHPRLTFFRKFERNACPRSACELHSRCHGGCPAHGFIHQGDLSAPDPRCMGNEQV